MAARILFLADSHLGFDLPLSPRVQRRRRGPDFLANYLRALQPALEGTVHVVVHAGDVFHRSRPHHTLVAQAFEPLRRIAARGIPVFVVPGNHERSRIPHARFASHPGIHVFDRPRSFRLDAGGVRMSLLGFPYERRGVRRRFPALLAATGWRHDDDGAIALLCLHHCVEGARVGPADFTFRRGPDVIRCEDLPPEIAAVLTGHVHRHQVLTADLHGRPLAGPVIYPGSLERTAFAEVGEPKGTVLVEVERAADGRARVRWRFREMPTRPMCVAEIRAAPGGAPALVARVRRAIASAPEDAVLRLRVHGALPPGSRAVLAAASLRRMAPPGMNVDLRLVDEAASRTSRAARSAPRPTPRLSHAPPPTRSTLERSNSVRSGYEGA